MNKKLLIEAAERNKGPILEVLKKIIPEKFGTKSLLKVLEIGSGTGQHAVYFCKEMDKFKWHPSDIDTKYIDSIKEHIEESKLTNIEEPINLNICEVDLDANGLEKEYDILMSINLVHISPWKCTEGLFKTASKLLPKGGVLVTYGPYSIHGEITPESNVSFNENLKNQNPEWGLRDIDDLEKEAKKNGLTFDAMFDMPSNNKTLIWLKQGDEA